MASGTLRALFSSAPLHQSLAFLVWKWSGHGVGGCMLHSHSILPTYLYLFEGVLASVNTKKTAPFFG